MVSDKPRFEPVDIDLTYVLTRAILVLHLSEVLAMAISLRLPEEIEARLDRLAALTGRSKTYYATEAICEHLDDLEDLYVAEQRMIEIRAGRTETLPLEEVMKQHGLED